MGLTEIVEARLRGAAAVLKQPGSHVLVVEDDGAVAEAVRDSLDAVGHRVTHARHGLEALDLLERGLRPEIVLLDLMMPVMNGWDFLLVFRRDPRFSRLPVVVLSAADESAENLGVQCFLRKPLSLSDLLEVVERFSNPRRLPPEGSESSPPGAPDPGPEHKASSPPRAIRRIR